MKLKDFKFNENDVKTDFTRTLNISKKIRYSLDYLVNHLPVNKLKKDNSFDFSKLKFNEGKNYNWYFLNNKKTTMLIRQYGNHFTFIVRCQEKYDNKLSVFTIHDNRDKMDDKTNYSYLAENFQCITEYLP